MLDVLEPKRCSNPACNHPLTEGRGRWEAPQGAPGWGPPDAVQHAPYLNAVGCWLREGGEAKEDPRWAWVHWSACDVDCVHEGDHFVRDGAREVTWRQRQPGTRQCFRCLEGARADCRATVSATEHSRQVVLAELQDGPMPFRVIAHRASLGRLVPAGPWVTTADGRTRPVLTLRGLDAGATRSALHSCVDRGLVRAFYAPRFTSGEWPTRKRPMRVFEALVKDDLPSIWDSE